MATFADSKEEYREQPVARERVSVRMNLNTGSIIVKRRNSVHGSYGETLLQTPRCVEIENVEFRVQDKAHEKVVDQGSRDVCAYAVGDYIGITDAPPTGKAMGNAPVEEIRYNPFVCKYFHLPETENRERIPVESAERLFTWSEATEDGPKGRMMAHRAIPHQDVL